jgi:hypothetical protein
MATAHLFVRIITWPKQKYWSVIKSSTPSVKKNVILEILGQIIKDVKWPRFPLFICHIMC